MPQKPLTSILIKPAGPDCNLDCTYCFYLDRAGVMGSMPHRMNFEVLEATVKQALSSDEPHVSFGWQGGEPTLMGLPFFQKAVELQMKYGKGKSVGNGLQTNGVLLDADWAKFLKEYRFLVGLSIDGPQHIHDYYRKHRGGQASWPEVTATAKLLLEHGVEVNALTVVNDYSVQFPEEIYQFHKELGLNYMQFIPCVETDPLNPASAAPFSVSAEAYGKFLVRLYDLWRSDFRGSVATTSVRFFDSVFHKYVGLTPPDCTMLSECGVYVVVEHSGDVYSCDFFVKPEWKLGNVLTDELHSMLNSPLQTQFGKWKADLPAKCRECRWLQQCRGGCPKDRTRDPRDQGVDHFCEAYLQFFDHAHADLLQLAKMWTREQSRSAVGAESDSDRSEKVGRNDPCPCGSGQKYKRCCGRES